MNCAIRIRAYTAINAMTAFVDNELFIKIVDWRSRLTDEEHESLEHMERKWKETLPSSVLQELLEVYPEGRAAAKRAVHRDIKELKKLMSSLPEFREVWTKTILKTNFKLHRGYLDILDQWILKYVLLYEKEIRRLAFVKRNISEEVIIEKDSLLNPVSDEQIQRAKQISIDTLIKVNRAHKALCVWHSEKNPSMHVYKDHAYCFSCARAGDAIDIYMAIHGCEFLAAVRKLAL